MYVLFIFSEFSPKIVGLTGTMEKLNVILREFKGMCNVVV